jgi:hypothetical protein
MRESESIVHVEIKNINYLGQNSTASLPSLTVPTTSKSSYVLKMISIPYIKELSSATSIFIFHRICIETSFALFLTSFTK